MGDIVTCPPPANRNGGASIGLDDLSRRDALLTHLFELEQMIDALIAA